MRVAIHISKFYDWVKVPADVVVTEADVAAKKVMPGQDGGWRMRAPIDAPNGSTVHMATISESLVIEKIIEEKSDHRREGKTLTRRQAVARVILEHIAGHPPPETGRMPQPWFELSWIQKVHVEDDGPSEELMRAKLAPHTVAAHARKNGRMNVPPEHVEDHVRAYMEPTVSADMEVHLHKFFGLPAPVPRDKEVPS